MDTVQVARKILRDAETSLRKMIQKALAEQQYGDVKDIAELAEGVAKLLRRISSGGERAGPLSATLPASAKKLTPRQIESQSKQEKYPFFAKDGDRLIKVGWSKKNKKEYEHRVPRDALITIAHHLDDKVEEGKIFDVEGLLPIADESGEELPAYQMYVALAWLRSVQIIEKKGRDGYVMTDKSVINGNLEQLWRNLAPRSA